MNGISWNRIDKRKSSLSEISSWRSQIRSSFIESKMESLRSVGRLIATSVPEPVKEIQIPAKLESTAISENPGNENSPSMEQQASDTTVQKVQDASQITAMSNSVQAEEVVKIERVDNSVKRTSISRKEDGVVRPSKVVTFSSDTKTDSPVKPRNKERLKQSQMKSLGDWTCLPDLKTAKAKPDVTPMETTSLVPEYFLAPRCNEIVKSSVEVKKSKSSNPNSYCVLPAIRVFGVDNLELLLRRSLTSGDKPSRYSMTESTSATSSSSVLSASCKRSSSAERLHQRTPELLLKSGKFEMFTSNRNLFSDLDRKPKHKAINDRDLLQVSINPWVPYRSNQWTVTTYHRPKLGQLNKLFILFSAIYYMVFPTSNFLFMHIYGNIRLLVYLAQPRFCCEILHFPKLRFFKIILCSSNPCSVENIFSLLKPGFFRKKNI